MNSINDSYKQIKESVSQCYGTVSKQVHQSKEYVASTPFGRKISEMKNSENGKKLSDFGKKFDAYVAAACEVIPMGHYMLLKKIYAQKRMQAKQEIAQVMVKLQKDPDQADFKSRMEELKKAIEGFKVPKNFSAFVKSGLVPHTGLQVSSVGVAVSVNEMTKRYIVGSHQDQAMSVAQMFACAVMGGLAGGTLANFIEKGLQYQTADKGFFQTVSESVKKMGIRPFAIQGMGSTVPREIAFNFALASGVPITMVYANKAVQNFFGSESKASEFLVTLAVAIGAGYVTSPLETCRAVQHNSQNPKMSIFQAGKQIAAMGDFKKFFPGATWRNTRIFWYLMVYPYFKNGFNQALSYDKKD